MPEYDAINALLRSEGLMTRRVMTTPGWESAAASIQRYWEQLGRVGPAMGPVSTDTWFGWIHMLSHELKGSHSAEHAECEMELVQIAVSELRAAS